MKVALTEPLTQALLEAAHVAAEELPPIKRKTDKKNNNNNFFISFFIILHQNSKTTDKGLFDLMSASVKIH
jgi:hypothetical protein